MDRTVVTTMKAVFTVLGILLAFLILFRLASVFTAIFISIFIVLSLEPAVKFFMKQTLLNKPVSRGLAVTFAYVGLVLSLVVILTVGVPPILGQTQKLLRNTGSVLSSFSFLQDMNIPVNEIVPQLSEVSDAVVTGTATAFSTVAAAFTIIILSIYISLDWENIKKWFYSMFRGKTRNMVVDIVADIEKTIGAWVKGQLALMVFVGFMSFSAILILGIDYPLALGLVSGLLEIVPILGPLLSGAIASLIGFSISPAKGFAALILFWAIQQFEASYLIPRVMGKVSGFSPLVVLLAILVAGTFFGALGAVIAVPITMSLVIILRRVLGASNL